MNQENRPSIFAIFLVIFAALVGGCAASGGADGGSERDLVTSVYEQHAGPSRERVVFPRLDGWRQLSGDDIVVRTRFNDYFLLTLESACGNDLLFGSSLRLAIIQKTRNRLSRFDTVSAGDSRCRIQYIREVDHQAVAAALEERGINEPFIRLNRDR